ncbi:hypothetical protein BGX38DRAFT_1147783 [Terfezia claveryi]|nr:hypothetical protein BGX38DRAFT_1147783 [Terfezia claveryi]
MADIYEKTRWQRTVIQSALKYGDARSSEVVIAYEYKLARFFHQSKTSMKQIDQFFRDDLLPLGTSRTLGVGYRSGHTWRNKMGALIDQPAWQHGTVDFYLQKGVTFFYRDVEQCIHYLLHQKVVYTEIHTGDWWWDTQMTLPVASSLVPILITSDQTCLTNFSGDKKLWPIFISVGIFHQLSEISHQARRGC